MSDAAIAPDIRTPPAAKTGIAARLLANPSVQAFGMRVGLWISRRLGRPLRLPFLKNTIVAFRYMDAIEVLRRDLEFRIEPINRVKIEAVNGPFILGLDRGVQLAAERAALYQALGRVDLTPILHDIAEEAAENVESAGATIDVVGAYARPIAAHTATAMFGIAGSDATTFMDVTRALFAHIFLNPRDDRVVEARALRAAPLMRAWFEAEIERRTNSGQPGTDLMGALLAGEALDDDGVRRALGGMLVGSIDTTATCVAKIVAMIGKDATLAKGIAADVDDPARLAGWCREALRLWPHNPLVMRAAAIDTDLAGYAVKAGDKVVALTQAAMLDPTVFPDPRRLDPERPTHVYMHFGAGLHPCAGRALSDKQIPLLVGALVRRGIKSVGLIEWAGPFPDRLIVTFNRRP